MSSAKPRPILIISGLLLVLALLSTTSTLTARLGIGRRQPGSLTGNGVAAGNFQGNNNAGGGNFQGGNGASNPGGRNFQGGGNFQGRGGGGALNAFSLLRTTGINFQVIGYITLGLTILGIALALLSAYGVWNQKTWGLNLGMLIASLFLLSALPGLFSLGGRNINLLRSSITILTLLASAPILFFGILPSVRDTVTAK